MKRRRGYFRCLPVVLLLHLGVVVKAQDPHFTQFYAAPIYLNPALAGQSGKGSFGLSHRQQWPNLSSSLSSTALYIDHYLPNFRSGFGVILNYHKEDLLNLTAYDIGAVYSYDLKLSDRISFRSGYQISRHTRNADFSNLIFGDQLDIATGTTDPVSLERLRPMMRSGFWSVSVGGMFYQKSRRSKRSKRNAENEGDWWLGASIHHLNEPNQSIDNGMDELPAKVAFQMGYVFSSKTGPSNPRTTAADRLERSWTLIANYKTQGRFRQLDLGLQYFWEPLLIGLNYRGVPLRQIEQVINHESLILIVGLDITPELTLGLSHDFPISTLSGVTGGSHEISLSYNFSFFKVGKRRIKTERICAKR